MEGGKDSIDADEESGEGSAGCAEEEVVPRGQVIYYAIVGPGGAVLSEHRALPEAIDQIADAVEGAMIIECRPVYPSVGHALEDKLQRDASVIISMLVWDRVEFVTGTAIARKTSKGRADAIALLEREGLIVRRVTSPKGGRGRPGYVVSLKKGTKLDVLRMINTQLVPPLKSCS